MLPDPPAPAASPVTNAPAQPRLRRVLGLRDLVFYGIVLIQPVGAVGTFGWGNQRSLGHVSAAILLALVAMVLTAVSYGRMAALYPAAGSAYTYVGRGLNPHLGFIAGWAMFLDYLVIPVVSVIYGAESLQQFVGALMPGIGEHLVAASGLALKAPRAEYVVYVILLVSLSTFLNLRGIRWTALANEVLTAVMCLVVVIFAVDAVRYLMATQGWAGLLSTDPFYNPRTFSMPAVASATSLVALTYIGFDGITTLAEDVKDPKRTVPLAVVLTCLFIGFCAVLQVYLAQRAWPDYSTFKNLDTAFFDVCALVGGKFLFNAFTLIMTVACLGSALTGQVGAARILFGMGRDNALPRFFARLDHRNNPALNIWIIGILVLIVSLVLHYSGAAELINFGAFLAFLGVNLAVIREFVFRPPAGHKRNWIYDLVLPGLAFGFCLYIWLNLPVPAKVVGGIWCGIGLVYTAIKTRGFRTAPIMMDLE
ncbi:MAG: putrescine importer [Verrucomicrobiota bacterium]